jgi:medium-chain acyl-[acyl-carrier-protein] hydrolase
MIKNGYKREIELKYSEIDYDKSLKPYSLLNYFQDIASDNAEELGFGYSYITPKNLMWVLLKYRIEFDKYPVDIPYVTVKTEPRGYNRLFAYRDFEIYEGEKLLGRAASTWSLVDIDTLAIANVEKSLQNPNFSKFEAREDDLSFVKIPQLEKIDIEKEFEVRYNDLDVNRHANNGNYIVWAFEPLSFEFKSEHKPKIIDMVYKKEIKYGEKLLSQVQFIDNKTTLHYLKNSETGDDLCLIKCEWY